MMMKSSDFISLEKTVDGMTSNKWYERLFAEYAQTHIRIQELNRFLRKQDKKRTIDDESYDLMRKQFKVMRRYLHILAIRVSEICLSEDYIKDYENSKDEEEKKHYQYFTKRTIINLSKKGDEYEESDD